MDCWRESVWLLLLLFNVFFLTSACPRSEQPVKTIEGENTNQRVLSEHGKKDCIIDIKVKSHIPELLPLLLKRNSYNFTNPTAKGLVNIPVGTGVRFLCPGTRNYLTAFGSGVNDKTLSCVGGNVFTLDNKNYNFPDLGCNTFPVHAQTDKDSNVQRTIDVGFVGTPIVMYTVFFDTNNLYTMWSREIIEKSISGSQDTARSNSFIKIPYFKGIDTLKLYGRTGQVERLTELLGSEEIARSYMKDTSHSLVRGHLSANADFVYNSQMRTTFYLTNVAPQWQTLNGGNWKNIEGKIRKYAAIGQRNLRVYTGTHGVTSLKDGNNNNVKLFLLPGNKIPVPAVFWKVVIDADSAVKRGIAFVAVNNPYISAADVKKDKDIPCKSAGNVCGDFKSWVPWDQEKGFIFCCRVSDLWKEVPKPKDGYDLDVSNLLEWIDLKS